jgi:hypothetical protein
VFSGFSLCIMFSFVRGQSYVKIVLNALYFGFSAKRSAKSSASWHVNCCKIPPIARPTISGILQQMMQLKLLDNRWRTARRPRFESSIQSGLASTQDTPRPRRRPYCRPIGACPSATGLIDFACSYRRLRYPLAVASSDEPVP